VLAYLYKSTKKFLSKETGMSLMEIMTTMGISIPIILMVVKIMETQHKTVQTAKQNSEIIEIIQRITNNLTGRIDSCEFTLSGVEIGTTIDEIKDTNDNILYKIGTYYGTGRSQVRITKIQVNNSLENPVPAGGGLGNIDLVLDFERKTNLGRKIIKEIPLLATGNSSGFIQFCRLDVAIIQPLARGENCEISLGGTLNLGENKCQFLGTENHFMYFDNQGVIQRTTIFYDKPNKRVGIGTATPWDTLHIHGSDPTATLCVSHNFDTIPTGNPPCPTPVGDGSIYAKWLNISNRDFAEYFISEEEIIPGDIVGLSPETGMAKYYQPGDFLIGVASANPAFLANSKIAQKENTVVVGLIGQLPINSDQIIKERGKIFTLDHKPLGLILPNDIYFINISTNLADPRLKFSKNELVSQLNIIQERQSDIADKKTPIIIAQKENIKQGIADIKRKLCQYDRIYCSL